MDKEKFFTVIAGIGGIIALLGIYLIGFYHGVKVEKERSLQKILAYKKEIVNYKRELIEKEQRIKELEKMTKKIVNITKKVNQVIDNLPSSKEEDRNIDQIFILQNDEDEKKVKEKFLLEPDNSLENLKEDLPQESSFLISKKETSLKKEAKSNIKEKQIQKIFWTIQLGAFLKYNQAKSFLDRLSKKIDLDYFLFIRKEEKYYKVCLGKFSTKQEALKTLKLLKAKKVDGFIKKVTTQK